MISIIRRSAKAFLFSLLNLHACRISSRKSADTFITKHFPRSLRHNFGRKYSVLIETAPDIATECGVSAGIHIARIGGTAQTPCFVRSVIYPARSKQQLVLRMRMLGDHVPVCEVGRHAGHLAEKSAVRVMKYALALVQHFLSQYRENSRPASAIPDGHNASGKRYNRRQAMLA